MVVVVLIREWSLRANGEEARGYLIEGKGFLKDLLEVGEEGDMVVALEVVGEGGGGK